MDALRATLFPEPQPLGRVATGIAGSAMVTPWEIKEQLKVSRLR